MKRLEQITERARRLLARLPAGVELVAAAKTRTPAEIRAVLAAGVRHVGHNYVQEAEASIAAVGRACARWHLIGHLQRNKVKRALDLFDLIETVDSRRLADSLQQACERSGRTLPVLIEVNSAGEEQKAGVLPDQVEELARHLSGQPRLQLTGLMTMGPFTEDPEDCRPAFRLTRQLFEHLRALKLPGVHLETLSMGMSDSWQVAVEEGANLVRIGTALFGPRPA